jgi:hypothetical protein
MTSPCCSAGGAATPTLPRLPSAASFLLGRRNLKHDIVEEADLTDERLSWYRAVLVPNAAYLADETIARIERWLRTADRRLAGSHLTSRLFGQIHGGIERLAAHSA